MSIFTDIFAKILAKVKGLVPGANAVSDVNLTVELDKLAGGRMSDSPIHRLSVICQTSKMSVLSLRSISDAN